MRYVLAYMGYLLHHKAAVWRAGRRLGVPVPALLLHDLDKLGSLSLYANAYHFHVPNPPIVKWRHYRHSKHHFQSWSYVADDGTVVALPIPDRHRREMLSDWTGAALVTGGKDGTSWYRQYRDTIALHPQTRAWVEKILGIKGESSHRPHA